MAQNKLKKAFPLRLRPDLIKQLKREAKKTGWKTGPFVEEILEEAMEWEGIICNGTAQTSVYPTYEGGPKHNTIS